MVHFIFKFLVLHFFLMRGNEWVFLYLLLCGAGKFLRMFLGPINVRANRKDLKLKVKEEYNNIRVRHHLQNVNLMFTFIVCILLHNFT